jgi:hypothetical protein
MSHSESSTCRRHGQNGSCRRSVRRVTLIRSAAQLRVTRESNVSHRGTFVCLRRQRSAKGVRRLAAPLEWRKTAPGIDQSAEQPLAAVLLPLMATVPAAERNGEARRFVGLRSCSRPTRRARAPASSDIRGRARQWRRTARWRSPRRSRPSPPRRRRSRARRGAAPRPA